MLSTLRGVRYAFTSCCRGATACKEGCTCSTQRKLTKAPPLALQVKKTVATKKAAPKKPAAKKAAPAVSSAAVYYVAVVLSVVVCWAMNGC